MKAYVYKVETGEITFVIYGTSNEQIESFVLPHLDADYEGLCYTSNGLHETNITQCIELTHQTEPAIIYKALTSWIDDEIAKRINQAREL